MIYNWILGESVDIIENLLVLLIVLSNFIFEKQPNFDLFHNISIYFIILDESVDIIENVKFYWLL
jgi:hypothetical protein